jgi:hypothetical protein
MRHRALAATLLLSGVVACSLIVGIEPRPLRTTAGDAGLDAPPPDDLCRHTPVADPPSRDDSPEGRQFVMAINWLSYEKTGTDVAQGFDLDGTCTCTTGPTAHDGGPSCIPPDSGDPLASCDFADGIDDELAKIPYTQFDAVKSDTITRAIGCGRGGVLIVLVGYNGRANDSSVSVGIVPSFGILTPHEAGEPLAVCDAGKGPPPTYRARFDGTDRWSANDRFATKDTPINVFAGYVVDWTLVVRNAEHVPLTIGPIAFEGAGAELAGTLVPLDATGKELPTGSDAGAAAVRLDYGRIGGRVPATSVLAAVETLNPSSGDKSQVCPGGLFYEAIKVAVCTHLDLTANPGDDFTGAACSALSVGVSFTATPAVFGDPTSLDAGPPPCADSAPPTCG